MISRISYSQVSSAVSFDECLKIKSSSSHEINKTPIHPKGGEGGRKARLLFWKLETHTVIYLGMILTTREELISEQN